MPISLILRNIKNNLNDINYNVNDINYNKTYTLKNSILMDDNCTIEIISSNKFNVDISFEDFSTIVANNFYYNYNRCYIQQKEIITLKNSNSVAWFLISTYYYSFFAANEISNLMGIYNFNFDEYDKLEILNKSITDDNSLLERFLNDETKNFYGKLYINKLENKITIKCESGGGKPHKLAWDNMLKIVNDLSTTNPDVLARLTKLKSIFGERNNWKKPSQIRNEWNYSNPSLYFEHDNEYRIIRDKYFDNYSNLKEWSSTRRKTPRNNNNDQFISILYLYKILSSILEQLKDDIII